MPVTQTKQNRFVSVEAIILCKLNIKWDGLVRENDLLSPNTPSSVVKLKPITNVPRNVMLYIVCVCVKL